MIEHEFNKVFMIKVNDDCITCNRSCEVLMYSFPCKHCGEKGWRCHSGFSPIKLSRNDNGEPIALEKCQEIARKNKGA